MFNRFKEQYGPLPACALRTAWSYLIHQLDTQGLQQVIPIFSFIFSHNLQTDKTSRNVKMYTFDTRTLNRTVTAPHSHSLCREACGGCGERTTAARKLHDFCSIFARPPYGFASANLRVPVEEIARCSYTIWTYTPYPVATYYKNSYGKW